MLSLCYTLTDLITDVAYITSMDGGLKDIEVAEDGCLSRRTESCSAIDQAQIHVTIFLLSQVQATGKLPERTRIVHSGLCLGTATTLRIMLVGCKVLLSLLPVMQLQEAQSHSGAGQSIQELLLPFTRSPFVFFLLITKQPSHLRKVLSSFPAQSPCTVSGCCEQWLQSNSGT